MKEKIRESLMNVLNLKELNIEDDTPFNDIGFDSLAKVELVIALEDEFKIQIEENESVHLKSINATMDLLKEKLAVQV